MSILPNGTPPNDGMGVFGKATSINTSPAQAGTVAVTQGYFDGTSQLSLVAVNSASDSISIFPDASVNQCVVHVDRSAQPHCRGFGQLRGAGTLPDLVVLYSNGTIQFFTNISPGPGKSSFTAGQMITGLAAVVIAGEPLKRQPARPGLR